MVKIGRKFTPLVRAGTKQFKHYVMGHMHVITGIQKHVKPTHINLMYIIRRCVEVRMSARMQQHFTQIKIPGNTSELKSSVNITRDGTKSRRTTWKSYLTERKRLNMASRHASLHGKH